MCIWPTAQADRRERYITEEQSSGKLLSLEQMEEDALLPDYVGAETAPSAETEALEREELRNLAEQKQILLLALLSLKDDRPGTHQRPVLRRRVYTGIRPKNGRQPAGGHQAERPYPAGSQKVF